MTSILLPATDTAVVLEALVLAAVTTGLLLALRRKPAAHPLVGGAAIFVGSLMALRAVH